MCVCVSVCVLIHSVVSDSANPRTVGHQAPLSMEFSRQGYQSGLPFPSPGHLPGPGIKPVSLVSPAFASSFFFFFFFFTTSAIWEALWLSK